MLVRREGRRGKFEGKLPDAAVVQQAEHAALVNY